MEENRWKELDNQPRNSKYSIARIEQALKYLREENTFGKISGSELQRFASAKTLTHWNGMPYLGMLTSLVWSGRKEGYSAPNTKLEWTKGSLLDLYGKPMERLLKAKMTLATASSFAYVILQREIRADELSKRPRRSFRRTVSPGKMKIGSGGWMIWLRGNWECFMPSLSMGKDLVPSRMKGPSPIASEFRESDLSELKETNPFLTKFHGDEESKRDMQRRISEMRGVYKDKTQVETDGVYYKVGNTVVKVTTKGGPARNEKHPLVIAWRIVRSFRTQWGLILRNWWTNQ